MAQDVYIESPLQALQVADQLITAWYEVPRVYLRGEATNPEPYIQKLRSLIAYLDAEDEDSLVDVSALCRDLWLVSSHLERFRNQSRNGDPHLFRGLKIIKYTIEMLRYLNRQTDAIPVPDVKSI